MKFQLNIEFDSLDEYALFSSLLKISSYQESEERLASKKMVPKQVINADGFPPTKGFRLTDAMKEKIEALLDAGKPFHTSDIVDQRTMDNAKRRTFINQWLKSFPHLTYEHVRKPGEPGRGPLMFTPVRMADGRIILPKGKKPGKSDWPIKGAAAKKAYAPIDIPDDEEFTILELSKN